MKISFDGLRKTIAADFNILVDEIKYHGDKCLVRHLKEHVNDLRGSIGGLLACYDSEQILNDFNDLSEKVELFEL